MHEKPDIETLALEDIEIRSTPELRDLYETLLGQPAQHQVSRNFLLGNLAWDLQAHQHKHNPGALRKKLLKRSTSSRRPEFSKYQVGTRLVREWHGDTYEVTITDLGYLWQDKYFRSLTAIARQITGANWSGPRFFGLKNARSE